MPDAEFLAGNLHDGLGDLIDGCHIPGSNVDRALERALHWAAYCFDD
jgi:hypothetical protein